MTGEARPTYELEAPAPPPWLASLRVQVAARTPRLARCFEGAALPGALKWTAAFAAGRPSDQRLTPLASTTSLPAARRACVLKVLSTPGYRLPDGGAGVARVSLVIEF